MAPIDAVEDKQVLKSDDSSEQKFNQEINRLRKENVLSISAAAGAASDVVFVDFGTHDQLYESKRNEARNPEPAERQEGAGKPESQKQTPAPAPENINPDWKGLMEKIDLAIQEAVRKGINADPFDGNGIRDITPSGVNQAGVGDCFFLAALASLANSERGRQIIKDMIKQNADGSYTVTFPGDKTHPITVTQRDLDDTHKKGEAEDSAKWARIIETAFLKYEGAAHYSTGIDRHLQIQGIGLTAPIHTTTEALTLLTGESAASQQMGFFNADNLELTIGATSRENVARFISQALKDGKPITTSAMRRFLSWLGANDPGELPSSHVYSVLDYDPQTNIVTIRNPWGNNDGTPWEKDGATKYGITSLGDGKLQMSLDTFMRCFNDVSAAGIDPITNNTNNIANDLAQTARDTASGVRHVLHGELGAAAQDAANVARDVVQTVEDEVHAAVETTEVVVKKTASVVVDTAASVGHYFNPLNWF